MDTICRLQTEVASSPTYDQLEDHDGERQRRTATAQAAELPQDLDVQLAQLQEKIAGLITQQAEQTANVQQLQVLVASFITHDQLEDHRAEQQRQTASLLAAQATTELPKDLDVQLAQLREEMSGLLTQQTEQTAKLQTLQGQVMQFLNTIFFILHSSAGKMYLMFSSAFPREMTIWVYYSQTRGTYTYI